MGVSYWEDSTVSPDEDDIHKLEQCPHQGNHNLNQFLEGHNALSNYRACLVELNLMSRSLQIDVKLIDRHRSLGLLCWILD